MIQCLGYSTIDTTRFGPDLRYGMANNCWEVNDAESFSDICSPLRGTYDSSGDNTTAVLLCANSNEATKKATHEGGQGNSTKLSGVGGYYGFDRHSIRTFFEPRTEIHCGVDERGRGA